MTREFKGANPFDKEPVSDDELLGRYGSMTPEDMDELIQTEGYENVEKMIGMMEDLKRRKNYA